MLCRIFSLLGIMPCPRNKGIPQDWAKANELFKKAEELGHAEEYCKLGCLYGTGQGVERDWKKAKLYNGACSYEGECRCKASAWLCGGTGWQ